MNSFRVVDTRFRILKGGKIGLAASIALIGGMLTLGSTSANAETFFNNNVTFVDIWNGAAGGGGNEFLYVDRAYNSGSSSGLRTSTSTLDDVIFDPSYVSKTFTGVSWNGVSDDPSVFNLSYSTNVTPTYDITFNSGANANNIYKDSALGYTTETDSLTWAVGQSGTDYADIVTYNAGTSYTANLIFNGTNVVSGDTDIDGGNIELNGGVTFAGTVQAGSADVKTSSQITFNDNVDLTQGTTDTLKFYNGGNVVLNKGLTGNVNFNGQNATVTLSNGNIVGDINTSTNGSGTLKFTTSTVSPVSSVTGKIGYTANLKEIIMDGTGYVDVNGTVASNLVTFNSAGTLQVNSLNTTRQDSTLGTVNFKEFNGTLKVDGGNLTGNVVTDLGNNGIVTMMGGSQSITGQIGTDTNKIKTLNIGSGASDVYSNTTINGDVFATTTSLNSDVYTYLGNTTNNFVLTMASGYDITSDIVTGEDGFGILNLAGGTQTVDGTVGTNGGSLAQVNSGATSATSTFTGDVFAVTVSNTGNGSSTFNDSVTATTINVGSGTSTFKDDVTATNTNISSGTGNFNTLGGTTISNITFTADDGVANLYQGLTGAINFGGEDSTVNVWDSEGISGAITTTTSGTGILNYRGDGTISSTVGALNMNIDELNINTNYEQSTIAGVTANDDIFANSINLKNSVSPVNNATLTLADNVDITTTTGITTNIDDKGTLTFNGTSTVNGLVGTSTHGLSTINAGEGSETVTFNGLVNATTLNYTGNGRVILNGEDGSASEGLIGKVDFNNTESSLEIGDNVNLTISQSGIQFENANDANLRFNGTSTVTGVLGGDTDGNSTFRSIYAGEDSEIVTFKNDVYVQESSTMPVTFHVIGTGTVNFEGNLYGDLEFDDNAELNVADTKNIYGTVKTTSNGSGILNFLGSTTLNSDIGEDSLMLSQVNFGTSGEDTVFTQDIGYDVYAYQTTIGNGDNLVTANIKDNVRFGEDLRIKNGSTLNVADNDVTVDNRLILDSDSTTNFKVYTDISAGQAVENEKSGRIDTDYLSVADDAKFNITYDGSWYGAGQYTLVSATNNYGEDSYLGTEVNGLVTDNSIIDSVVKTVDGDLVLFADRTGGGSYDAEDLYIEKSDIGTNYSNGASQSLAGYANGTQREGALADIINEMEDLDGGVVITDEKKQQLVEIQQLLAPVANNSAIQSSLTASNLALGTIGGRISEVRGAGGSVLALNDSAKTGLSAGESTLDTALWIKAVGSTATQDKVGQFDGYDADTYGIVAGADKTLKNGTILGLALAYSDTETEQSDFRAGDSSDTNSIQATAYASKDFGNLYVDGMLSYAKHSTDAIRTANSGKLSSDIDANQYSAKIETGYKFVLAGTTTLTPFASIEYGTLDQKSYTEKGTSYQNDALKVDGVKVDVGTFGLGAKLATNVKAGNMTLIPELTLAAYNSFGDDSADIKAQYVGGGNKFITPTQELNETMFNIGAGVKTALSESSTLILDLDHDRSENGNFEGYSGSVSYRLSF